MAMTMKDKAMTTITQNIGSFVFIWNAKTIVNSDYRPVVQSTSFSLLFLA